MKPSAALPPQGLPKPLLRRLVQTAGVSWLAVRIGLAAVGTMQLTILGVIVLCCAVLTVAWLDLRRNTELLLYANLALSPVRMFTIILAVALLLEVVIGTPMSDLIAADSSGSPT